jgi:hypothetical protein
MDPTSCMEYRDTQATRIRGTSEFLPSPFPHLEPAFSFTAYRRTDTPSKANTASHSLHFGHDRWYITQCSLRAYA